MSIDFSKVKNIIIPEGTVKKIIAAGKVIWQKIPFINLLPFATDMDRKTIYNGCGYITGYRLSSSSGGLTALAGMCTSGFIPAKPGDVLRIYRVSHKVSTQSYVMGFNSSNVKTGDISWHGEGETSIYKVTLTESNLGAGFDSFRFCCGTMDENTIVTLNEEFEI